MTSKLENLIEAHDAFSKLIDGSGIYNVTVKLSDLAQLLCDGPPSLFFISGSWSAHFHLDHQKLMFQADKNSEPVSLGLFGAPDVDAIKKYASVAPFGRGTETVVDEKVRSASQIPAANLSGFPFDEYQFCTLFENEVTDAVKMMLGRTDIEFQPYKLHIYSKGGHFDKHRDTLHQANHVATLVMCLPSQHTGGELLVYHGDEVSTFDSQKLASEGKIGWCVFFTDCEHEVLPVTSGDRVVLQFDVFADLGQKRKKKRVRLADVDFGSEFDEICPVEIPTPLLEYRTAVIQAVVQETRGTPIAILLRHMYGKVCCKPEHLRGFDRRLYDMLQNEFDCDVLPYMLYQCGGSGNEYDAEERQIQVTFIDPHTATPRLFDTLRVIPSFKNIHMSQLKGQESTFTGNDASPSEYTYMGAALIVQRKVKETHEVLEPQVKRQKLSGK